MKFRWVLPPIVGAERVQTLNLLARGSRFSEQEWVVGPNRQAMEKNGPQ